MHTLTLSAALVTGAFALAALPMAHAQDAEVPAAAPADNPITHLIATRGKAIVTVRTVMNISFMGRNQEMRQSATGVIVDASGLILTTNLQSTDAIPQLRMMRRQLQQQGAGVSVKLQSAKVVVEGVENELDAFLVATDSELGISFLQIEDLGERTLAALSFDESAKPELGDLVYAVTKLSKAFDYATVVRDGRIGGIVKKPRTAYAITGGINALGLPLFNAAGSPLGVFTGLAADGDEGGETSANLLLPARPVKTAISRALPKATELLAERAAKKAEGEPKDGEGEKKDGEGEKKAEKPPSDGSGF